MVPRAAIQKLARAVRTDLGNGRMPPEAYEIGEGFAGDPDALLLVVDLMVAEAGKKKPELIEAYAFILTYALEILRQRVEAGQGAAGQSIGKVIDAIVASIDAGSINAQAITSLAAAFARAGLDPGDSLRGAYTTLMVTQGEPDPALHDTGSDPAVMLAGLVKASKGDPFEIHTECAEMSAAMLPAHQLVLLESLARSAEPALREAALGWLLAAPAVRRPLAEIIAATAGEGLVSQASLGRLMIMRNWMPDEDRRLIDTIIKAARSRSTSSPPRKNIQVQSLLMSERDGAGAQSVYAVIKEGRKYGFMAILVKQGHGVRDTMVRRDMAKSDVDLTTLQVSSEMTVIEATIEDVGLLINHALSENQEASPIPFGLVQAIELLGLPDIAPRPITISELVEKVLANTGSAHLSDERSIERILQASRRWQEDDPNIDSWFEASDAVTRALEGVQGKVKRTNVILNEVLPKRRAFWAEVIGWSALASSGDEDYEDQAFEMAVVAHEIAGDRPLKDFGIAKVIASQTVAAADYHSLG